MGKGLRKKRGCLKTRLRIKTEERSRRCGRRPRGRRWAGTEAEEASGPREGLGRGRQTWVRPEVRVGMRGWA